MRNALFGFLLILLTACSSIEGERYVNDPIDLDLYAFFDGNVRAWGIVQDRSGNLVQRFEVDIIGSIKGGQLILDETFRYSLGDGPEKRIWTISRQESGYTGNASDIEGPATGTDYGNAFYWTYQMDLPVGNKAYRVKFEDWIWALNDEMIVNRSYIKKFGIVFAEVTLFMQKTD